MKMNSNEYKLPALNLLQPTAASINSTQSNEDLTAKARLIQETLVPFDIRVSVGDITQGPSFTRYELHPAPGVKLERFLELKNNLLAALKVEHLQILAPIPGKSTVGIEVPNAIRTKVVMRDLFESDEWRDSKASVPIALGKDVYKRPVIADLAKLPHLLIAGQSGSDKSVCLNVIITSLLYCFTPEQLRFMMIDSNVVELQQFNILPHLASPIVTDPKSALPTLHGVMKEIEKRLQIFARAKVRNIEAFNKRSKPLPRRDDDAPVVPEKLSYLVVVITELADLMEIAPSETEMVIARITRMACAAGIHCIIATRQPSVDVLTSVIKSNIPARIAFSVGSRADSRTILDTHDAYNLLGNGDMLFAPSNSETRFRFQGASVTDQELQSIVDFISQQNNPTANQVTHID